MASTVEGFNRIGFSTLKLNVNNKMFVFILSNGEVLTRRKMDVNFLVKHGMICLRSDVLFNFEDLTDEEIIESQSLFLLYKSLLQKDYHPVNRRW